jgi:hypothetical protein
MVTVVGGNVEGDAKMKTDDEQPGANDMSDLRDPETMDECNRLEETAALDRSTPSAPSWRTRRSPATGVRRRAARAVAGRTRCMRPIRSWGRTHHSIVGPLAELTLIIGAPAP